jgi:hypothetical protein
MRASSAALLFGLSVQLNTGYCACVCYAHEGLVQQRAEGLMNRKQHKDVMVRETLTEHAFLPIAVHW